MSGSAFFISLVVLVQCVHGVTNLQTTPLGPDVVPSRMNRLKNAFLSEKEAVAQIGVGSQCYGQPGTGSSCGSASNGCCGQCSAAAPYCGGTTDDNAYWAGCRASSTAAGATYSACNYNSSPSPSPSPSSPASGIAGTTTRYWDCCKASCSWPGKASVNAPVSNCAANGVSVTGANVASGCNGGSAYMCSSNQPITVNPTLAFGFAAAYIAGQSESNWCSACYQLIFTSGPVSGKTLIVQVTNTGGDLGAGQFDLQIPGGGVGLFNGCSSQWNASSTGWGAQYGGISSASQCSGLPAQLQGGCNWRFGSFFQNANNPTMTFTRVRCNSWFAQITGSTRTDDANYAYAAGTTASTAPPPQSYTF